MSRVSEPLRRAAQWIRTAFERGDGKASQNRIAAMLCVLTACVLALWKPAEHLTVGTLLLAAFGKLRDRDRDHTAPATAGARE